jgi:hypothetical protein
VLKCEQALVPASIEDSGANDDIGFALRTRLSHRFITGNLEAGMIDTDDTTTRSRPKRTTFVSEATWQTFGEFKAGIIGRKGERAVARVLSALGVPALHDALLPDLLGVTQLDHLVRAPDAILVIETKTYGGHITGTLDSAGWVQHLDGGETRHAFQNPVHQNFRHCRAVEPALAGLDVVVAGLIVSAGSATFCDALEGRRGPIAVLG